MNGSQRLLLLRKVIVAYLAFAANFISTGAFGEELANLKTPSSEFSHRYAKLDSLTISVLKSELELERLTLRFLLEATPQNRWKGWRYFLFQEADAAGLEAGLQVGVVQRARQLAHKTATRIDLEDSLVPQMVGQFIGPVGDVVELSLNAKQAIATRRKKLDAKSVGHKVFKLQLEIEKELNDRSKLVADELDLSKAEISLLAAEQKVLLDLRDLAMLQFVDFRSTVRRQQVTQNTFYMLDIAKNITGALGNLVGLDSQHDRKPALGVPSSILTTISGSFIVANPILSRLAGAESVRLLQSGQNNYDEEQQRCLQSLRLDLSEFKRLSKLCERDFPQIIMTNRIAFYESHQQQYFDYVKKQKEQRQKAYTAALGRVFVGSLVGSTKISSGITGIIAAERYPTKPFTAAPMLFAGTTAYASGTAITLADNLKIEWQRELNYQRNKNAHQSPREVIEKRLSRLDQLEASLRK